MLEHHAHLLPVQGEIHLLSGDVHPVEQDGAGGGRFQQVQAPQERALAAAGGADHRDDIALVHVRRYTVQRLHIAAVVILFQVVYLDQLLCHQTCTSRCCLRLRS